MKSMIKVFVLAALVCLCAAEDKKEERYSSFECVSYDKEHPEDLSMRNCILRDVVLASEHGQPTILFYAKEGQETPLLSADKEADKGRIVEMAPHMFASVKVVRTPLPDGLEPMPDTAVVMTAQSNGFAQFMLDTLYSVYWMLSKTGDLNMTTGFVRDMERISIVEVGRPNDYTKITQGSLTGKAPAPLRYLKGVLYSRVIVGPAGHHLLARAKGSAKTVEPDAEVLKLYRSFFIKVAQIKDEDFDPTRIIISQRFTDHRLANTEGLLSSMTKVGGVQVAFLNNLPVKSQIDLVGNSGVFISMHSDDMAYMVFMRPDTVLVELFPYGYESDVYKKLAETCGVKYASWHNTDRSKTKFDPKILDKYPLTAEQKKAITEADKYDASMPSGALAYWENQDTTVDIPAVVDIVKGLVPPKPDAEDDADDADDVDEEEQPQHKQEL